MSKPPICGGWTTSGGGSPSCSSRLQAVMISSHSLWNRLQPTMSGGGQRLSYSAPAVHSVSWHVAAWTWQNDRQLVDALLSYRDSLPLRLRELLPETIDAMKIRHHGDFHLGQMLIVKDDISIIDFEGEPRRSLEDRRRKAPAARDVAGLIR